jgi:hypothetical protein
MHKGKATDEKKRCNRNLPPVKKGGTGCRDTFQFYLIAIPFDQFFTFQLHEDDITVLQPIKQNATPITVFQQTENTKESGYVILGTILSVSNQATITANP